MRFEPGELTRLAHIERTPPDIRDEHAMLEAEVNNLRSVLKGLLADVPRKEIGGVDLDALFHKLQDGSNVRSIHAGIAVPVINKVTAGYPHHFTDLDYPPSVADEYIRCPDLSDPQAFAARVVGDSMEPVYHEGDIVVFSPNTETRNGDDCLVRFDHDNSTTFKRIYMDDEQTVRLQPLNSAFPAETFRREQISGLWAAVFRVEKLRRV